jgi:hypothetical protein
MQTITASSSAKAVVIAKCLHEAAEFIISLNSTIIRIECCFGECHASMNGIGNAHIS